MKNLNLTIVAIVLVFTLGCSKHGLFPDPANLHSGYKDDGLSDDFFAITTTVNGVSTNDDGGTIAIPNSTSVTFSVNEFHRKVKDVKWMVDGKTIASGNNASVSISAIGINRFNVSFKEISSGRNHNREMKLYVFKEMELSVAIAPNRNICGDVAIGITSKTGNGEKIGPLYLTNSVQKICTSEGNSTARIARVPVKVYDTNTSFSIDLIEPNKTTSTSRTGVCFVFFCIGGSQTKTVVNPLQMYQTDYFSPASTNNLKPGQYTSGGTVLTLE